MIYIYQGINLVIYQYLLTTEKTLSCGKLIILDDAILTMMDARSADF
jgi:hypothetical protein